MSHCSFLQFFAKNIATKFYRQAELETCPRYKNPHFTTKISASYMCTGWFRIKLNVALTLTSKLRDFRYSFTTEDMFSTSPVSACQLMFILSFTQDASMCRSTSNMSTWACFTFEPQSRWAGVETSWQETARKNRKYIVNNEEFQTVYRLLIQQTKYFLHL